MRVKSSQVGRAIRRVYLCALAVVVLISTVALWHDARTRRMTAHEDRLRDFASGLQAPWISEAELSNTYCLRVCHRLVIQPGVRAVRFWNESGMLIAEAADRPALLKLLPTPGTPPRQDSGAAAWPIVALRSVHADSKGEMTRLDLELGESSNRTKPIRASILVEGPRPIESSLALFTGIIGLAAIAAGAIGMLKIRRMVDVPLRVFLAETNSEQGSVLGLSALDVHGDEWGVLAQRFHALQRRLCDCLDHSERTERRMVSQLSEQTQRIMREVRRLQREACQDTLTGAMNRRLLEDKLSEIVEAQRKAKRDLSLVMIDLDRFKLVNDVGGHEAGDEILRFAGELLRQCTRESDLVARYGGDEFLLVLPDTNTEGARTLMQRISAMFVQRTKMMVALEPAPTLSVGIAGLTRGDAEDPQALRTNADRALYDAKRSGGGRIVIYDSTSRQAAGRSHPTFASPHA